MATTKLPPITSLSPGELRALVRLLAIAYEAEVVRLRDTAFVKIASTPTTFTYYRGLWKKGYAVMFAGNGPTLWAINVNRMPEILEAAGITKRGK